MPFSLVRCLVKNTLKYGGDALGGGILPIGSIASSVFEEWCSSRDQGNQAAVPVPPATEQTSLRAELEGIVQDVRTYRNQVDQLLSEMGTGQQKAVLEAARTYLHQVPGQVQSSLRRPDDPSGRTVPPGLVIRRAEDLKQLLPERMPRFQPESKVPNTDLVLKELLGVGGFGEVWKAVHESRPNALPVALKFCLDETAARTLRKEVDLLDRIEQQVQHPGIVKLRYVQLHNNPPFLEYEYVEGGDLAALVTRIHRAGKGSPLTMTQLFYHLARSVGAAHRIQPPVVHRDLKPANILAPRSEKGYVLKVLDFGIGGLVGDQLRHAESETPHYNPLTQTTGSCTPLYASPQQRRGDPPDLRDDVYALGVIWYQMLAGDVTKESPRGGFWKKRFLDQGATPKMVALLESCLEDEPADRPADAFELAEELKAIIKEAMPSTQPIASAPSAAEQGDSTRHEKRDAPVPSDAPATRAHGGSPEASVLATVADVLNEDSRWEVVARSTSHIDFMPKDWLKWLPPLGKGGSRSWTHVRLHVEERRLDYAVEMAAMEDSAKRIELGAKLLEECFQFGLKRSASKEVKNNRSRISAVENFWKWGDATPEPEAIRGAVKQMLDDLSPKLEKLARFLKPLCE